MCIYIYIYIYNTSVLDYAVIYQTLLQCTMLVSDSRRIKNSSI